MSFKYDGLNRQVSRTVSGTTTYSTWDGWNLVEEYTVSARSTMHARYLYGATGLVKELENNHYYYQDASGSNSHLLDSTGSCWNGIATICTATRSFTLLTTSTLSEQLFRAPSLHRPAMVSGAWPIRYAEPLLLARSRPLPSAGPDRIRRWQ